MTINTDSQMIASGHVCLWEGQVHLWPTLTQRSGAACLSHYGMQGKFGYTLMD